MGQLGGSSNCVISGFVLTGNTGGDDNNISTGQGVLETIILGQEAGDFLIEKREY